MKINISIRKIDKSTDVRTIVDIGGKIYSDGTGLTTMGAMKGRALELEILESIKGHITGIQLNIQKKVEGSSDAKKEP